MILRYQGRDFMRLGNLETRQQTGIDKVIDLIVREAQGEISFDDVFQLGNIQAAIGMWRLAFSLGEPSQSAGILTPVFLGDLIESLLMQGEAAYQIELDENLRLLPISSWSVSGNPEPSTWVYKAQIAGPDKTLERDLPRETVLHVTWSTPSKQPWKGSGPLENADISSKLAAVVQSKLLQEVQGMPVGGLLPVAGDPADAKYSSVKQALKTLKGKLSLVESETADSHIARVRGNTNAAAVKSEWMTKRVGSNPPESLIKLCKEIEISCLGALQVPRDLILGEVDGTALRESWRRFVIQVKAIGRRVATEIERDLDLPGLSFSWEELQGPDIAQRARAFAALVKAGMSKENATDYALSD